jgi:hypothetical protein
MHATMPQIVALDNGTFYCFETSARHWPEFPGHRQGMMGFGQVRFHLRRQVHSEVPSWVTFR